MAFFTKRYHPPGTPPGTLHEAAADETTPLRIRLADYSEETLTVRDDLSATDCASFLQDDTVTWVHVQGLPTEAALRELGSIFKLHNLALEDVLNTGQRPKIEPFNDQTFIIMSLPLMKDGLVEIQQVSLFLSDKFLVSFCVGEFAPLQSIVRRLEDNNSRLRSRGVDFLLYSLLDIIIDQGFPVLENFGLQLEDLEENILEQAERETLAKIHIVKRELILLRRMLWPQREVINSLLRGDYQPIQDDTLVYFRDCYDHTVQVMDLLETYRDMTGSMLDIYLSSVSNRMNDIMRVLTVIATIFIPLTFVTGIYGMNFDRSAGPWNMPELSWPFGYLLAWLVMIFIAVLMIVFFRKRHWV